MKIRAFAVLAVLASLLAGVNAVALAQGPTLPVAPGEVSGRVLVTGTATPIPHASVAVRSKATNALVAGALAVAGLVVLHRDGRFVFDGLKGGDALPLVIASFACGIAVLVLLQRGGRRGARPLAVGAVVAVVWAWGVAQHPYLLPQVLTIDAAAAPGTTLTTVLIVFGVAVLLVLPSLGLLFTLVQRNLVEETERPASEGDPA